MAAPVTTYQIIKDTTEHVVIKLTGSFDSATQEDNPRRIKANTLYGALDTSKANLLSSSSNTGALSYYGLNIQRLWYDSVNAVSGDIELYWYTTAGQASASSANTIMLLSGSGEYNGQGNWVTIPSNAIGQAGCNGDIGLRTRGMAANGSYTIIMELRKDNSHYQRGHLTEPGAFNYGAGGLRP